MINKNNKFELTNLLFVMPAILIIFFVFLFPIFKTVINSFYITMLGSVQAGASKFVGFRNYIFIFKDDLFWTSIQNNFILFIIIVPLLLILSITLSVLLYEKIKGWQFYRTIVFIPYVLPIIVVGISFSFMFQRNGVVNLILDNLSLGFLKLDWLARDYSTFGVLIFMIIWKELGFGVILMLARLLSIDKTLSDAGKLDGCNWWQLLIHVIIPQMSSIIYFYTILTTITAFTWLFNYVFILTRGGPGNATTILELYIYNQAFKY